MQSLNDNSSNDNNKNNFDNDNNDDNDNSTLLHGVRTRRAPVMPTTVIFLEGLL